MYRSGNHLPVATKRLIALVVVIVLFRFDAAGQSSNAAHYYAYVACESDDRVDLVHFHAGKAEVIQKIPVGVWPAEIEGPHGLTVSPDQRHWFVTMAHGNPYGQLYKYETGSNRLVGSTTLGLFPATMDISRSTGLLYAVNFNLHGDMVASTVSVVDPGSMMELEQIQTGIMPHGSRLSADGLKHYSVSMMDGFLHEVDAVSLEVMRTMQLDESIGASMSDEHNHAAASPSMPPAHSAAKPTWVTPHPLRNIVYVALNGLDKIVEIDTEAWTITRTFETGAGPYNLAVSSDGETLVATYKKDGATGIWDLAGGEELYRVGNSRRVSHGVLVTPDDKFAFVSAEGIGAEPGTVDVIDLETGKLVGQVDVGKQAGGIFLWKQTDAPIVLR